MRAVLLMAVLGCGHAPVAAPAPETETAAETAAEAETETGTETPDADADAAPAPAPAAGIPEIEARVILARMFRDAGFRIVYDVPVVFGEATVAVDGFDPEARVGYEYRAAEEQSAWNGELPEGSDVKLLVVGPADRDTVERRGKAFLAGIARP